jgi:hypothetical protein
LFVCLHLQACKDETLLHMVDLIHDAIPNTPKAIFAKYSSPRYARASLVAKAGYEGLVIALCRLASHPNVDLFFFFSSYFTCKPMQVPPAPINTTFVHPSCPYPSPPSRFGDSRSSSIETLHECWTSPSAQMVQRHQQPTMVPVAFVPTTVLYSVGYIAQAPMVEPLWRN